MSRVKIKPEDKWFSLYIRARDNWTDQWKGTKFRPYIEGGDNHHLSGLHCAHCFTRGAHMTRFDERNCVALSYGSHSYLDSHPREKEKFFRERLGDDVYEELEALSKKPRLGWKKEAKNIAKIYKEKFTKLTN